MKVAGSYTFEAPQETVWETLQNPGALTSVLPGCERLDEVAESIYEGELDIKVGPVQGKFKGRVEMCDLEPTSRFRLEIDGRGSSGFVRATARVELESSGASTIMHYDSDAQVGGRIASVGQRLLDSSAKSIIQQSLDGLQEVIRAAGQSQSEGGEAATAVEEAAADFKAPTQAEFAAQVAKDVAKDVVPRPLIIGGAIVLLLLLLYVLFF
jgi:carbon monoxide dehydrogenase subunit G